ncbi:MAG: MarR family transcriptional regulator [Methanomicrobiales archaeon]|nr:MarR family transcriptional regulator [Methanomicrobiales archaeon]
MREEEIDWILYHIITATDTIALPELCLRAGVSEEIALASAERLERGMLIARNGDSLRALSVQESLLLCQLRHAGNSPITVENGVIKVRDTGRETKKP